MSETLLYRHVEAGFESFLAENYVDYMNNVMPVPESHIFFLPERGIAIICEIEGTRHLWSLRGYDRLPPDASRKPIEKTSVEAILKTLGVEPEPCTLCDKLLLD